MRDHEKDTYGEQASTVSGVVSQAEPGVSVPASILAQAVRDAEKIVEDLAAQKREMEQQRDGFARQVGTTQDAVDRITNNIQDRKRQLRQLMATRNG